ncbi:hypothetical protein HCH54_007166 [Aspergillus fumigatus]
MSNPTANVRRKSCVAHENISVCSPFCNNSNTRKLLEEAPSAYLSNLSLPHVLITSESHPFFDLSSSFIPYNLYNLSRKTASFQGQLEATFCFILSFTPNWRAHSTFRSIPARSRYMSASVVILPDQTDR